MITWGKTIRKFREKLKLTQSELASRVGVTSTYVSSLEHNRKEPSFSLIKSMSKAFGMPQEILYWDAITPTKHLKSHAKEIRLAKSLANTVFRQIAP